MHVLVTGGAGYIGSHTALLLRNWGYDVTVLDSLEHGHREAVAGIPLIVGNIKDERLLQRVFADRAVDAVLHFAAYKAPAESIAHPERYFDNNVCGSLALLRAMARAGVKRLVFSSSAAVYGMSGPPPIRETDMTHPENPYGESKLMVEQMLRWLDICLGLRYVSLRYFNAAGAALDAGIGEDPADSLNLIPRVMQAALGHLDRLPVYGTDYPTPDGTAIRDYVHVLDLADAHIRALKYLQDHHQSGIFNVGTGHGWSVKEVIDMARRITGVDIPAEYAARRPGDPAAIWADNTRARALLGWRPVYDLEAIIRTAWQWHVTHPHGFATVDKSLRVGAPLAAEQHHGASVY